MSTNKNESNSSFKPGQNKSSQPSLAALNQNPKPKPPASRPGPSTAPAPEPVPGPETGPPPLQTPMVAIPTNLLVPIYSPIEGVPRGLEALHNAAAVGVRQELQAMEAILPVEFNNRYSVLNLEGQRIYFAAENTGGFDRQFRKDRREFRVIVFDGMGNQIMYIERDRSSAFGGTWSGSVVSVSMATEDRMVLGRLVQEVSCCTAEYYIQDLAGGIMARIQGDSGAQYMSNYGDVMFYVTDPSTNQTIATINRQFKYINRVVNSADSYGVMFMAPIDARLKALLLGAVILIDFNFFEQNKRANYNNSTSTTRSTFHTGPSAFSSSSHSMFHDHHHGLMSHSHHDHGHSMFHDHGHSTFHDHSHSHAMSIHSSMHHRHGHH